jgi:hypothetical protein
MRLDLFLIKMFFLKRWQFLEISWEQELLVELEVQISLLSLLNLVFISAPIIEFASNPNIVFNSFPFLLCLGLKLALGLLVIKQRCISSQVVSKVKRVLHVALSAVNRVHALLWFAVIDLRHR